MVCGRDILSVNEYGSPVTVLKCYGPVSKKNVACGNEFWTLSVTDIQRIVTAGTEPWQGVEG
jgi:hypothetical protein